MTQNKRSKECFRDLRWKIFEIVRWLDGITDLMNVSLSELVRVAFYDWSAYEGKRRCSLSLFFFFFLNVLWAVLWNLISLTWG